MFCTKCGKELKENWSVCPYCGKQIPKKEAGADIPQESGEVTEDTYKKSKEYNLLGKRRTGRFSFLDIPSTIKVEGETIQVITKGKKKEEYQFKKQEITGIDFPTLPFWTGADIVRLVVFGLLMLVSYGLSIFAVIYSVKIAMLRHLRLRLGTGQVIKIPICQKADASEFLKELHYPEEEIAKNDAEKVSDKKWASNERNTCMVLAVIAVITMYFGMDMYLDNIRENIPGESTQVVMEETTEKEKEEAAKKKAEEEKKKAEEAAKKKEEEEKKKVEEEKKEEAEEAAQKEAEAVKQAEEAKKNEVTEVPPSITGDIIADAQNGSLFVGTDNSIVDYQGNQVNAYAGYFVIDNGAVSTGSYIVEGVFANGGKLVYSISGEIPAQTAAEIALSRLETAEEVGTARDLIRYSGQYEGKLIKIRGTVHKTSHGEWYMSPGDWGDNRLMLYGVTLIDSKGAITTMLDGDYVEATGIFYANTGYENGAKLHSLKDVYAVLDGFWN